ncbi:methylenetetrahydrofolate reductase [NAD(P)H] [bacterium]|nr:methylenetetrahydrofolate reductase [NAD(P)H] [bacterium]
MSFRDLISEDRPSFSFEFFPPKKDEQIPKTKELMAQYAELDPAFMTVTYGAGGGTRDRTRELTGYIATSLKTPAVAHLTCVGHSRQEIDSVLDGYRESGVSYVLALRGDPPKGETSFTPHEEGFSCARDLVAHIRERGGFHIAVAGYPEGHPEASSPESEQRYLGEKVRAGGEVIITQLFFSEDHYFRFVEAARSAGIQSPIIPGIMPIRDVKQLERFTSMCGATIPERIRRELQELGDDTERIESYGIETAVALCRKLLAGGAPGIHFYTLNRSLQVKEIHAQLTATIS